MWNVETTTQWERDLRWYEKKRPHELAAVMRNLERYIEQLNAAKTSKNVIAGFLHAEPHGVVAVDQKGGGGNLQETRLYTYADDEKKLMYLITIGDKDSQADDIQLSKNFVEVIKPKQPDK
jgi:hypothetical protein